MEQRERRFADAVNRLEQAIGRLESAIGARTAAEDAEVRRLTIALSQAQAEAVRPDAASLMAVDQSVIERLDHTIGRLRGLISP